MAQNATRTSGQRRADGGTGARTTLLNAALELLSEKGPGNVSLHDVAAKAELNVALVRYYFGSKDKLFRAVIDQIIAEWRVAIEAGSGQGDNATERLRRRIISTTRLLFRYPFLTRLIIQQMLAEDAGETDHFLGNFATLNMAQLRELLAEGHRSGEFRAVDPKMFFFTYVGISEFFFMSGPMMKLMFGVDRPTPKLRDRFIEHVVDMVLHGVAAPGAAPPAPRRKPKPSAPTPRV